MDTIGVPTSDLNRPYGLRLVGKIVGAAGEGVNRRQRVPLVGGDKAGRHREILVMTPGQFPALRVRRANLLVRIPHREATASSIAPL